uniref:molybdate ABC transporter substrate-binding protein n=1 Tax=Microbacterium sp. SORGH_AS_1204 TaxID=3041785 RepID=UPI0027D8EB60|nr:molybdate ABC transporter substrate-binding protein [Microbacterium sp. SORGH_AS_1204]
MVFAAASLRTSFTELADAFEHRHPGVTVELSFAGSADLATQIINGAPADVFASADLKTMTLVSDAGLLAADATVFATNHLEIATPPANPAGITSLSDLGREGTRVVICAPQVPCGAAAEKVLTAAGVIVSPVSEESSVTDVLGKIISGEADAGLVYTTDIRAAGSDVQGIPTAQADAVVNDYPLGLLQASDNPAVAARFADFVRQDPDGILDAAGFGAP